LFKSKKSTRGNTSKDGSDFEDQDYDVEHTVESINTAVVSRGEGIVENDDNGKDSKANFKRRGRKNARSSLQIPPKWLLETVFSMTFKAIRTCPLTLKM